MRFLDKITAAVYESGKNTRDRIFRLLVAMGSCAMLLIGLLGYPLGMGIPQIVTLIVGAGVFHLIGYLTDKYDKPQLGAKLIALLIILVILPVSFINSGGMYGGTPVWFLFCAVFIALAVRGRIIILFMSLETLVAFICYYIAWFKPELIRERPLGDAFADSLLSVVVASSLMVLLIFLLLHLYRSALKEVKNRQHEIEEMNRSQNLFFSSMSHEIRTPINTIIGLNEMILREDINDEVAEDAVNIKGASKMLLAIINDILDMSKLESGKMDIVSVDYRLPEMISEIVGMIFPRAKEKGLKLDIDVDPTMPVSLYGDEVRIKQIIINLLNNAVKYTKEGTVSLSLRGKRIDDKNLSMIISVADTGMGIKKDSIPHLFDAFRRVDEEKNRHIEGTGLGLSIVRRIVDLMGGEISVNSVYTKGSTFVVTIPQGIVNAKEIGDSAFDTKNNIGRREHYKQSFEAPDARLLIVDDNEVNIVVEAKLLRETKLQIDTATSGEQCLKKALSTRYDVIFMDHLMPEMDGIDTLMALRSQPGGLNKDTPVIVLTANAGTENQVLYKKSGFDGYLTKPVSGIEMEDTLIRFLPEELVTLSDMRKDTELSESIVKEHKTWAPLKITTDSVCDLPKRFIEKHNIGVLPYKVYTEDGVFLDSLELDTSEMLSYVKAGNRAHSEPPTVEEYELFFAEQLADAREIIHITAGCHTSKGYEHAMEAAKAFDNVEVYDSGHISTGVGLVAIEASRLVESDHTKEEVLSKLPDISKKVDTSFIVENVEYARLAGRIGKRVAGICRTFMLVPVLSLKNSSLKTVRIFNGQRDAVREKYLRRIAKSRAVMDKGTVFLTHAGCSDMELSEIIVELKRMLDTEDIICIEASSAISINCGPGSFGVIFKKK